MQRDRERLGEDGICLVKSWRQRTELFRAYSHKLGKATLHVGEPRGTTEVRGARADVLTSRLALKAGPARSSRVHRHGRSPLWPIDAFT
jgi:hypothetical protein